MLSTSQQQLLQLLKIQPLQLRSHFNSASVMPASQAAEISTSVTKPTREAPDSNHAFSQDVAALLQQAPVVVGDVLRLGALCWSIDDDATEPMLVEDELITPPFSLLQQPALKQKLWQQLSHYLAQS